MSPGPQVHPGVVVFGGGGHARAVADALSRAGRSIRAVVAPSVERIDAPVIADGDEGMELARSGGHEALVAIGDNEVRLGLVAELRARGIGLSPFFATTATVSPHAVVAEGVVVLEHAHVGPGSTVGAGAIVNTGAVVEHDVVLGDGCHVAVGAVVAGGARCGARSTIGAGATVNPGVTIGDDVVLGSGGAAVRDVADGLVVRGVPARHDAS